MNKKTLFILLALFVAIAGLVSAQFIGAATYTQPTYSSFDAVPDADSTLNVYSRDVVGNKSDAAATGAVTTTESLMAYMKQNVTEQIVIDGIVDAILVDTGATIPGTITTMQGNVTDILADTAAMQPVHEMAVTKTLTTIASGNNNLFVVAGGPIKILEIVAYVATEIEGKSCLINYNFDPTAPATDTAFATTGTALEINGDAVGTLYTWDGVVANNLIATTNGVALGLPTYSGIIVPAGSFELAADVATSATGAITFYLRYIPLSTASTVTAA